MDGLDIPRPHVGAQASRYSVNRPAPRRPTWISRHTRLLTFLLFVVLPTAAVATYYFAVAADQYVSEAKFVVRGPSAQSPGMLSTLLQSTGMTRAEEDTYAVQDFIMSRDAMKELIATQGLKQVFDRPEADPLSRFPLLTWHATLEHFYDYYKKHIDVLMDSSTGVSTITVKTFRPDDSERITAALLTSAEGLINRMNARQRDNAMRDARNDIVTAEARVQAVAGQIADFRNREALLDPNKQSVPMLAGINDLQTMLSRTNLQLSQLSVSTPRSPLIPDLHRRADALQMQINEARAKITGTDASLVPKITAFDMLELQRQFADRQLSSATNSLEGARMQAERQQLYLETIVNPDVADYPAYPKRIAAISTVFASLVGIYVMLALMISAAREHRLV